MRNRDINITKYRKLLHRLQRFCSNNKYAMSDYWVRKIKKKENLTDYERGYLAGRHSAFNDVLRELEEMIRDANGDWKNVHCREETNKQENLFALDNGLYREPVDFALTNLMNDLEANPTQNTQICLGVVKRIREIWKKITIYGIETYGLTYEEFLNQLENKHVVFYTDEDLKDHLNAQDVIDFIKRIKNNF